MLEKHYLPLTVIALSIIACATASPVATPTSDVIESDSETAVGMANPASVYCEEQGGRLEIRTDADGGQYGVCLFDDGSECGEWAFFRGECQPGGEPTTPEPEVAAAYVNEEYGFSLDPPASYTIEEHTENNYVIFRHERYFLFVGYKWADETVDPFRTGVGGTGWLDGGSIDVQSQPVVRDVVLYDDRVYAVLYGCRLEIGDLHLVISLDAESGPDMPEVDIPAEVQAEADQIVGSLALISGETPTLQSHSCAPQE